MTGTTSSASGVFAWGNRTDYEMLIGGCETDPAGTGGRG